MADLNNAELKCVTIEVAKLDVRPGETVVIRVAAPLTNKVIERISEYAKAGLPDGVKLLVLDHNVTLSVVSAVNEAA